jgi:universal stress protein A
MTKQRILVPIDFSTCSRAALRFAVDLAQKLGAEIDVLHIWEAPTVVAPANLFWLNVGHQRFWQHMKRDLEKRLDEMIEEADSERTVIKGVRADADYVAGGIVRRLVSDEYDLCVVGTHGRTGLAHFLIGSVAERVVRLSPCPVITVPAPKETVPAPKEDVDTAPERSIFDLNTPTNL